MTDADLMGALTQIRRLLDEPGPMPRKAAVGMIDNLSHAIADRSATAPRRKAPTLSSSATELLRCPVPWCKEDAFGPYEPHQDGRWFVTCRGIGGHHTTPQATANLAVRQWNSRP